MDNSIIKSILEEEAQASFNLQATREKASALIRDTQEQIKQQEEETRSKARAHLDACRQEADILSAKIQRRAEEEAMTGRAVLRASSGRKMDRAAEAVLAYLG